MEKIILVDEQDNQIGTGEKLKVHKEGILHRAFSTYIFNSKGELLIQQRARHKYHCGGLWSNTCCSHPREGEKTETAAHRRLKEEMGFDTELREKLSFIYKVRFDNGLTEHEYLHVFTGMHNGSHRINPDEVEKAKWAGMEELLKDIQENPDKYTYWFRKTIKKLTNMEK